MIDETGGEAMGHVASLEELQTEFNRDVAIDKRAAAEIAYALAFRYRNEDIDGMRRFDMAKIWALRAIALLDSLPSATVHDVASTRQAVGGVLLPELLHSSLVRQRLNDVLV